MGDWIHFILFRINAMSNIKIDQRTRVLTKPSLLEMTSGDFLQFRLDRICLLCSQYVEV